MAWRALLQSQLTICVWAAILAGVIVFVRRSGMAPEVEAEPVDDAEPVDNGVTS
jgi:hypothetical protein